MAVETAADASFSDIVDRMWQSLNHMRAIPSELRLLSWEAQAMLVVCYFHRAHVPCPEDFLSAALIDDAKVVTASSRSHLLQLLAYENGWRILRARPSDWAYLGTFWTTGHQKIAEAAWAQRPLAWWAYEEHVTKISLVVPHTIRLVAELALALQDRGEPGLLDALLKEWTLRVHDVIETRHFCDFYSTIHSKGSANATLLRGVLRERAVPSPHGWLAAFALWGFDAKDKDIAYPAELPLLTLIATADFSIASRRAIRFSNTLGLAERNAFATRLIEYLDRRTSVTIGSTLFIWLLSSGPTDLLVSRLLSCERWLADNPKQGDAWIQFVVLLGRLPAGDSSKDNAVRWLATRLRPFRVDSQLVVAKLLHVLAADGLIATDIQDVLANEINSLVDSQSDMHRIAAAYLDFVIARSTTTTEIIAWVIKLWRARQIRTRTIRSTIVRIFRRDPTMALYDLSAHLPELDPEKLGWFEVESVLRVLQWSYHILRKQWRNQPNPEMARSAVVRTRTGLRIWYERYALEDLPYLGDIV